VPGWRQTIKSEARRKVKEIDNIMTTSDILSKEDLEQIQNHGLSLQEVLRQLDQLRGTPPYLRLVRPCKVGDGIEKVEKDQADKYTKIFEREVAKGRFIKFVPASGAATRMFRALQSYYNRGVDMPLKIIRERAGQGDKDLSEFLEFIEGLKNLAFYPRLSQKMRAKGLDIEQLYQEQKYREIVRYVLGPEGLGYGNMPKALVLFHLYDGHARTAFEEHLVEAANYVRDLKGRARLHFTVAHEHTEKFHTLLAQVGPQYEAQLGAKMEVGFSVQKRSTDTIAADLNGRPFRLSDGRLLLRPGGHGALIQNLDDLNADLVFIKNIDNVVPDHLKGETYKWKKILGGMLVELQDRIHGYLQLLHGHCVTDQKEQEVSEFIRKTLCITLPHDINDKGLEQRIRFYIKVLNRPLRVCGMVRNVGEPGGGPFWVEGEDGQVTRQIVEMAQIDPHSEEQQAIVRASTHFNPVDLVCAVRDWQGRPFELTRFVDHNAVFVTKKSKDGRDLKALELPGLWNGAMAKWITLFVEVPLITFNPVKTVNALLRAEHQGKGIRL